MQACIYQYRGLICRSILQLQGVHAAWVTAHKQQAFTWPYQKLGGRQCTFSIKVFPERARSAVSTLVLTLATVFFCCTRKSSPLHLGLHPLSKLQTVQEVRPQATKEKRPTEAAFSRAGYDKEAVAGASLVPEWFCCLSSSSQAMPREQSLLVLGGVIQHAQKSLGTMTPSRWRKGREPGSDVLVVLLSLSHCESEHLPAASNEWKWYGSILVQRRIKESIPL